MENAGRDADTMDTRPWSYRKPVDRSFERVRDAPAACLDDDMGESRNE